MDITTNNTGTEDVPVLPDSVPVVMPDLPARLAITTMEQMKAVADPTRDRILGIIQQQPATAKQVADRLKMAPGTINHHLQVLEAAGLAKVVARRLIRGIVAKYYTRTARIFEYCFAPDIVDRESISLKILTGASSDLAEALASGEDHLVVMNASSPRMRLSPERVQAFDERLKALIDDFIHEPYDPNGEVYTLCAAFFKAPPYLQHVRDVAGIPSHEQKKSEERP
jgi:DNA-binding transcriptional ArsR family regulator